MCSAPPAVALSFSRGEVAEVGSPEELKRKGGIVAKMFADAGGGWGANREVLLGLMVFLRGGVLEFVKRSCLFWGNIFKRHS